MGGRPLSFQPLPDFDSVRSDPDEFNAAVNAAVAALLPKAGIRGVKAQQGEAVLRATLGVYANSGGGRGLRGFIELLADLPDGVSRLTDARRIAAGLADSLHAATVNDPLFGGGGQAADPGVLLRPAAGKRARVSVISFVGLEDEQRQSFVSRLELALFSWLKRHPAGDERLGALFVMDEAQALAPSGSPTVATGSTVLLAREARKYGLGLIFATQAPRGLHNQIAGNATTQMLGLLNSPTQIETARDLARTKNSDVSDIGRLSPGQFYAAGEGMRFRKVRTRMCLSYHGSPLTREEVIRRAAAVR